MMSNRVRMRLGGFAAVAALAISLAAAPVLAEPSLVEVMGGDLVGLVSGSVGREGDDYAIVFQVAIVGAPVVVDGALDAGPTIRVGGWAADGRYFYETRSLPIEAIARLGTSWYLSIGDIPSLGSVRLELEETGIYPLPINQTGAGSSSWSSSDGEPVSLYAVGRQHDALFVGRSSRAGLRVEVDGVSIPLTHAFAYVGDRGSIRSTPATVCYRYPTTTGCRSFP